MVRTERTKRDGGGEKHLTKPEFFFTEFFFLSFFFPSFFFRAHGATTKRSRSTESRKKPKKTGGGRRVDYTRREARARGESDRRVDQIWAEDRHRSDRNFISGRSTGVVRRKNHFLRSFCENLRENRRKKKEGLVKERAERKERFFFLTLNHSW